MKNLLIEAITLFWVCAMIVGLVVLWIGVGSGLIEVARVLR